MIWSGRAYRWTCNIRRIPFWLMFVNGQVVDGWQLEATEWELSSRRCHLTWRKRDACLYVFRSDGRPEAKFQVHQYASLLTCLRLAWMWLWCKVEEVT